jgi:hypothetical protein
MPLLPLPAGGSAIGGGDLPVSDEKDVLAEFPGTHKAISFAPVRDAFVAAWTVGFTKYQDVAAEAAAQSDPLRATGDYLKTFANEHGVIPGANESEESIRQRMFRAPEIVTPDVIVSGVNAILAPFTSALCTLSELELDGYFVHDGTAEWDSFIGADPDYPERYYDDVPSLLPGGAVPSSGLPRSFVLRIPPLEDNDDTVSFVSDTDDGIFIGDGSDTSGAETDGSVATSVFIDPQLSDDLYAQIAGYVESIKGQGMSWSLIVDPALLA